MICVIFLSIDLVSGYAMHRLDHKRQTLQKDTHMDPGPGFVILMQSSIRRTAIPSKLP